MPLITPLLKYKQLSDLTKHDQLEAEDILKIKELQKESLKQAHKAIDFKEGITPEQLAAAKKLLSEI